MIRGRPIVKSVHLAANSIFEAIDGSLQSRQISDAKEVRIHMPALLKIRVHRFENSLPNPRFFIKSITGTRMIKEKKQIDRLIVHEASNA